jgi:6,7-dimethyl-8-ribityllumazine synthase
MRTDADAIMSLNHRTFSIVTTTTPSKPLARARRAANEKGAREAQTAVD